MSQITPDQLQALLGYASKRLGMTPEQLARTVQNGGLSALSDRAGAQNAQKINELAGDPARLQQLINSPEVQAFLSKLTGGKDSHG
ncbi:MAG: hypothetical protein IJO75_03750 [Clostridia bacterium]|nr:hypothetical protein [Clostridia bacterium]MBQ9861353.1 hypothetical protein [Clostridia bacterium]